MLGVYIICLNFFFERIKKYQNKKTVKQRDSEFLFEKGQIFNATDEELKNVIKEMALKIIPNSIERDREVVRAFIVTNIQNQRFIKSIENRNFVLTLVVILLTVISIYLTRLQVTPILLEQERSERRAYEICKNNPQGEYAGVTGAPIKCQDVFDILRKKFE